MPSASAAASLSASTTTTQTSTSTTKSHGILRRQYRSNSISISHALLVLFAALALLTTQPALVAAQSLLQERVVAPIATSPEFESDGDGTAAGSRARQDLVIFNYSSNYVYAGCYNDTNQLANTSMVHALRHVLVGEGYLTAPMCLEWCAHNGTATLGRPYKFAGLQYSRECYCGEDLNPLVRKLNDSACDTPCDGDNITACGGANKLSLYNISDSALKGGAAPGAFALGGGGGGLSLLLVVGSLAAIFGSL